MEDLIRIGCEGLLVQLWNLKNKDMAREFSQERSNKWQGIFRRDPKRWTVDMWVEIYSFLKEGRGQASRIDKFVDGKFSIQINPKDGHTVADCVDPREKRVLEFIVSILYSEKPSWIIVTVGNTIFGALSGARKVSWGLVIQELVGKLVSRLEKEKPSPISSYLFYLYHRFECLRGEEIEMLETTKYMLEYVLVRKRKRNWIQ